MNLLSSLLKYTADQIAALRTKNTSQDNTVSGIDTRVTNMEAQLATAISAVTVDSEVQNIRVGDDNVTYTSAGEAVRTQFSNVKADINGIMSETITHPVLEANYTVTLNVEGERRKYIPFELKKGKLYKFDFVANEIPAIATGAAVYLNIRTTSSESPSIVDNITGALTTLTIGTKYSYFFIASADASYLYIYSNTKSGKTNIDITVSENVIEELKQEDDTIWSVLSDSIPVWKKTISYTHASGQILRTYYPFKFEEGLKYYVRIKPSRDYVTANPTDVALNVRTSVTQGTPTIVDVICADIIGELKSDGYLYEFTASGDANYLYLYQQDASTDFTATFDIFSNLSEYENGHTGIYEYSGQRIDLKRHTINVETLMTTTKPSGLSNDWQGSAVFDNYLFRFTHGGSCAVYDLNTKSSTAIATFNLGSYDASNNHANSVNFGSNYYSVGDAFPLLYVNDGNSGDVMKCSVERITKSGSTFSSSLVQTIYLDQSEFESNGYVPYWGWPAWLIADDALYCFGAKYRTNGSMSAYDGKNKYIVTKFEIPNINSSTVTLTADNIKEQWTSEYDVNVTQGGCIYNDYLFYLFGFGTSSAPSAIKVFSLAQKICIAKIPLSGTALATEELEDVSICEGLAVITTAGNTVYTLDFA